MAKQIKEVYDRDHSELSDFHSINSFDSLTESCTSRKGIDKTPRIKIESFDKKSKGEGYVDNIVFEVVYSNDIPRLREIV